MCCTMQVLYAMHHVMHHVMHHAMHHVMHYAMHYVMHYAGSLRDAADAGATLPRPRPLLLDRNYGTRGAAGPG